MKKQVTTHDCLYEVITITEAAKIWDKAVSTLRHRLLDERFPSDGYRKSDKLILIKRSAMIEVYGEPKKQSLTSNE
ncbi:helix-turn-helix domain-containing protein [Alicyclobacillus fodiniaquatilis]|uniref:Helix-turn-helix domain-containing protein n=1 Tax=Alicyclobacillus fodiniaquatilis TaxID=1661150 RepID=A0ABW4JJ27_9BACL